MKTIHYIDGLAFSNQIERDKNSDLCEKIIKKFKEDTIKTEKLKTDLFSFRLNNKERVISTIIGQDKKNFLLVLELLPNHEYSKSKYLNNAHNLVEERLSNNYKIVYQQPTDDNGEAGMDALPKKMSYVYHHDTTLLLNVAQLNVLEDDAHRFIRITGAAGSGKTLVAELLIKQKQRPTDNYKILYVTQSELLVEEVTKHCNVDTSVDIKTFVALCENIISGNQILGETDFKKWLEKWKQIKSFEAEIKDSDNARKVYQDIRKIHNSKGSELDELGKKSLHYPNKKDIIKEISDSYQVYLRDNRIDLSLHHYPNNNPPKKYKIILVDEAQDFGKSELQYITSFLMENGSIYFFMDTNQSLFSDFNLTYQYINELANPSNDVKDYDLKTSYRTPDRVAGLVNILRNLKFNIIGGILNKQDKVTAKSIGSDNAGYIGWLDKDNEKALTALREESQQSIEIAFIVPNESVRKDAENLFPNGSIYTPATIKGLEFEKVVLVDFVNKKNSQLTPDQVDTDESNQEKVNFPKDTSKAGYSQWFNGMHIGCTRTKNSLYFVHINADKTTGAFKKHIKEDINTNPGEAITLPTSSPEEISQFIIDKHKELKYVNLLHYCKLLFKNSHPLVHDNLSESFESIKEILTARNKQTVDKEQKKTITDLIERMDLFLTKREPVRPIPNKINDKPIKQPVYLITSETNNKLIKSTDVQTDDRSKDKKLDNGDLFKIELSTISTEQLEQDIEGYDKNGFFLLLLIQRTQITELSTMSKPKLRKYFCNFVNKISKKALNQVDKDGKSALHYLIVSLSSVFTKMISIPGFVEKISKEALNQVDKDGKSTLYYLIDLLPFVFNKMANIPGFLEKIDENIFETVSLIDGWSPFFLLLRCGHRNDKLSTYLNNYKKNDQAIKKWKKIYLGSNNKYSSYPPLRYAIENFDLDGIEYLIKRGGIDINVLISQCTPLIWAIDRPKTDGHQKMVAFLVEHGADLNLSDEHGDTALIWIIQRNYLTNEHRKIIKLLLRYGADIDLPNKGGNTPLHIAAMCGDFETVKLLINNRSKLTINKEGRTPLHYAAAQGCEDIVTLLINNGADINLPDNDGNTPLLWVLKNPKLIKYEPIGMVTLLINNGADLNLLDNDGNSPLRIVGRSKRFHLAKLLKAAQQKRLSTMLGGANIDHIMQNISSCDNEQIADTPFAPSTYIDSPKIDSKWHTGCCKQVEGL